MSGVQVGFEHRVSCKASIHLISLISSSLNVISVCQCHRKNLFLVTIDRHAFDHVYIQLYKNERIYRYIIKFLRTIQVSKNMYLNYGKYLNDYLQRRTIKVCQLHSCTSNIVSYRYFISLQYFQLFLHNDKSFEGPNLRYEVVIGKSLGVNSKEYLHVDQFTPPRVRNIDTEKIRMIKFTIF